MRERKKFIMYAVLLLLIFIGIGYASLNTVLDINGTATAKSNTWDIHFENILVSPGSVTAIESPVTNNVSTTTLTYKINLAQPGDYYEFVVDAVNKGTIDAMVDTISDLGLTAAQREYIKYNISYIDGMEILPKHLLASNNKETYKVRIEFDKNIENSQLPATDQQLNLTFAVDYIQADNSAIEVVHPVANVYTIVNDINSNGIADFGDEIAIENEHFYIIRNNNGQIDAFGKYNLLIGNETEPGIKRPIEYPTGLQDVSAYGEINSNGYSRSGVIFSDYQGGIFNNYRSINIREYPGPVYDALYGSNGYENYIQSKIPGATVRLITMDELELLGCSSDESTCVNAPEWLKGYAFWTQTANSFDDSVWAYTHVYGDDYFGPYFAGYDDMFGVRPVVSFTE